MVNVQVKLLDPMCLPRKAYASDTGFDLYAREAVNLPKGAAVKVPLGVCCKFPIGWAAEIRPRSGLSSKGIVCAFGTVDNGYTGEICAVIYNLSGEDYSFDAYAKVAQLCLAQVPVATMVVVDDIDPSAERGDKGFGSTGV